MNENTTPYANSNSIFEQPWWLDVAAPGCWKGIEIKNESGDVVA